MKLKKEHFIPTLVLTAICLAAALLLAGINMLTAQRIADRENAAANDALLEVLPDGKNFKAIELDSSYPESVKEAYSADGGYVFRVVGAGRNGEIVAMVGVDSDGKIVGIKIITTEETPKYADAVYAAIQGENGGYKGMALEGYEPVIVAGSTMTSNGVSEAVKAALQAAAIAGGASVDLRTPEQIFQDNCNAALGTSGATFTKWFRTEIVSGVDAVYESEGGRVYVIGDAFVGVKDGSVTTADASDDDKAAALAADAVISASKLTAVEKPKGTDKAVSKIYVTDSGNYVFEIKASGYAVQVFNGASIIINIAISADGKIIDVITVSHGESPGIGDVCATEDYYAGFIGIGKDDLVISSDKPNKKNPDADLISPDCTDIGAIASATFTTYGYQKAVESAFNAFEILTGGGSTENE